MLNFSELFLNQQLIQNLSQLGYTTPTEIQIKAVPIILKGHDLLGIAQTGTGKTAAFTLPILEHFISHPMETKSAQPRALILTPTRELCSQIHQAIQNYAKGLGVRSCAIYGGVGQSEQVNSLRQGVEIVVATPGRLLDLLEQKHLRLNSVEIFILDEADRMLDMGFEDDLQKISFLLPLKKQSLLFSATMPAEIERLAARILKNYRTIEIAPEHKIAENIQQKVIYCKGVDKFQLLKKILKEEKTKLTLVFTRTRLIADAVVAYLAQNKIASRALHADKNQSERERAVTHFKGGAIKVLIATDIASRGLDIEGISHVINFDLPLDPESYVHRIGRTARAGKKGVAILFCEDFERERLQNIQQLIEMEIKSEKFEGKHEIVKTKISGLKKKTAPTPGKSQEKNAWLDHSKRQPVVKEGEKRIHPGFRKKTKKKK
jgi:ATP-dependent RNA helicase RhlE